MTVQKDKPGCSFYLFSLPVISFLSICSFWCFIIELAETSITFFCLSFILLLLSALSIYMTSLVYASYNEEISKEAMTHPIFKWKYNQVVWEKFWTQYKTDYLRKYKFSLYIASSVAIFIILCILFGSGSDYKDIFILIYLMGVIYIFIYSLKRNELQKINRTINSAYRDIFITNEAFFCGRHLLLKNYTITHRLIKVTPINYKGIPCVEFKLRGSYLSNTQMINKIILPIPDDFLNKEEEFLKLLKFRLHFYK